MKVVVAVSGGVDSMVLLDMLVHDRCPGLKVDAEDLIVAHFDHGIRDNSSTDEKFVRGVVGDYGLRYETERAELGAGVSEDRARQARYSFLRRCCKKYNAQLITAHHQDDLLETMLINLLRGTDWRGLVSLGSDDQIIRPLLDTSKSELLDYAKRHKLTWREDSTNADTQYLRNYIRLVLLPRAFREDSTSRMKLINTNKRVVGLKKDIATELQKYLDQYYVDGSLPRYQLIMLPPLVAREVIYIVLTQLDPSWHPSTLQLNRILHFAKTAANNKTLEVSGGISIGINRRSVQFKKV